MKNQIILGDNFGEIKTSGIKPINKMTIKDLKKLQQGAENEIVEYENFIQQIKKELRRRRK